MKLVVIAAGVALVAGPAFAAVDKVMEPIDGFMKAANAGKSPARFFAPRQSVTDEFAPFHWDGADAAKVWWSSFGATAKRDGMTDAAMAAGAPSRIERGGGHAYVIVPATFSFKLKGKPLHETGQMTFALDRGKAGWRIRAMTWTGEAPHP